MATTKVAKHGGGGKTLKHYLTGEHFKKQIAMALPRHLSPERFVRVAITALTRTPKLQTCTQESFFRCLLDLSSLGLEPDGRNAHLIPFGSECTLIVDYKGIADVVRRSGEVQDIHADVVCENDFFECEYGTNQKLQHKPNFPDRGKMVAAYSYVKMKDGGESFEVISADEVEAIRKISKQANGPAWKNHTWEMSKKSAFRRHSKWLPFSPELREKIEIDDRHQFDFSPAAGAIEPETNEYGQTQTAQDVTDDLEEKIESKKKTSGEATGNKKGSPPKKDESQKKESQHQKQSTDDEQLEKDREAFIDEWSNADKEERHAFFMKMKKDWPDFNLRIYCEMNHDRKHATFSEIDDPGVQADVLWFMKTEIAAAKK